MKKEEEEERERREWRGGGINYRGGSGKGH